ncbi:nucleotide exchange factor GrpE [Pelotomaculum propionicicum]|uniref:Protein GrpE n=1 Tax=Pelotomaculum propionicicum TaxID=258475 RepID=A0A4Y7RLH9_9FIRM|nr:nucleotide exchange factor GrpE [Pelotomaculum propionicicum]NLI14643.1 nucleotide exchange factor GrpE [Peptococcaceae bacterium]TEB09844.1 Protein GrpE [Pelotomaculum propionicicum]
MSRQESDTPQDEILSLRKELQEEKNRHLRTLADFDNYRKRVERDIEANSTRGKKELIKELIAVLDNFERAFAQIEDEQVKQGLQMVYQQLFSLLQRHGLEVIESLGKPFDPCEHEGIGYLENLNILPGHVAGELSRGYRFGGSLLRPARVMVAKRPVRIE